MPLQGAPLAGLVALWFLGRIAVLVSAICRRLSPRRSISPFRPSFSSSSRETSRPCNRRSMVVALALSLCGQFAHSSRRHEHRRHGRPRGAYRRRDARDARRPRRRAHHTQLHPKLAGKSLAGRDQPAPFGALDRFALTATLVALIAWVAFPGATLTAFLQIIAGAALLLRLTRWRAPARERSRCCSCCIWATAGWPSASSSWAQINFSDPPSDGAPHASPPAPSEL